MDFGLTPEQEALRQEVCAFIAEHVTPEVVAEMEGHNEGLLGVTLGTETIAQMLGPYAQLLNGSPRAIEKGIFAHNIMGAFQPQINHGSVQVMRDQVARRGLDMPRARKASR